MDDAASPGSPVEIPYARLTADVLRRIAEEFVTRDGTDYGRVERTLEQKVTELTRQLEHGEAAVVYDAESQTINVVTRRWPVGHPTEAIMGDRSPKSKQRDQRQKSAVKASDAAAAKTKQDAQSHALPNLKGKK